MVLAVVDATPTTGVMLATAGGVLLLVLVLLPRRARQLRWNNDPLMRGPIEYVADERGLSRRQTDFEFWCGWSRIRGYEESPGAFILRLGQGRPSDGPLLILAKRGLANPSDEAQLRHLLDARVKRTPAAA